MVDVVGGNVFQGLHSFEGAGHMLLVCFVGVDVFQ